MDVPFATLVQAPNTKARVRHLESRSLLRGGMPYKHDLFRNTFHFHEALNADEGENPNHCAGNRASWRRVESRCGQPPTARCILVKAKGDDLRGIIDKNATRCTRYAHVDNDLAGLLKVSHANTAFSDTVPRWGREIFAVSRDGRRPSGEVREGGVAWGYFGGCLRDLDCEREEDGVHSRLIVAANSLAPSSSAPARDRFVAFFVNHHQPQSSHWHGSGRAYAVRRSINSTAVAIDISSAAS